MNRDALHRLCSVTLLPAACVTWSSAQADSGPLPSSCAVTAVLTAAEQAACIAAGYGGAGSQPEAGPAPAAAPAPAPLAPLSPSAASQGLDALSTPMLVATSQGLHQRLADVVPPAKRAQAQGLRWSLGGHADSLRRDGTAALAGFRVRAETLSVGADRALSERWAWGAALATTRSRTRFEGNQSSQRVATDSLSGYAQWYPWPAGSVALAASREVSSFELQRDTGASVLARSSPRGSGAGLALTVGHEWVVGAWSVSPFTRWDSVRVRVGAYQESVAAGALAVDAQSLRSSSLSAGTNVQSSVPQSWGLLVPYARVEWTEQRTRSGAAVGGRLLSDNSALLIPAAGEENRRHGTLALGLTAVTQRAFSAFVDLQTGFAEQGQRIQRLGVGLRFEL